MKGEGVPEGNSLEDIIVNYPQLSQGASCFNDGTCPAITAEAGMQSRGSHLHRRYFGPSQP